jgi:DNA-binding PadR family transcriptional regulator
MHRHHHFFGDRHERGRHPWGGHMGGGRMGHEGHRGRHREGRVGRFLEHGDLRYVVLALLAEQPRHGYELIKDLEDRTGGAYRPSPGVIYPLLAMLEDEGLIRPVAPEASRKAYELTDEGKAELEQNRAGVEAVFGRMAEASQGSRMARPRMARAIANFHMALGQRMRRELSEEQLDRLIAIIDDTAAGIEKV